MSGGVLDGQPVSQSVTNAAFLYKNADDSTTGVLALLSSATSGPPIYDIQGATNIIIAGVGGSSTAPATAYSPVPSDTILTSDTHMVALRKLAQKFYGAATAGGHTHDGTDGEGTLINASTLPGATLMAVWNSIGAVNTTGASSIDVSSIFVSSTPSSAVSIEGIVVNSPYNIAVLGYSVFGSSLTPYQVVDTTGNEVYGRISVSGSVWTMKTYSVQSGNETGYAIPNSLQVTVAPRQLVNPLSNNYSYNNATQFLKKSLHSIAWSSSASNPIFGDATLTAGSGITIAQSSNNITITAATSSGTTPRVGQGIALANSAASALVTFSSTFSSSAYSFIPQIYNNLDTNPEIINVYKVTKAASAATMFFSPSTDSASYVYDYVAWEAP